MIRNYPRSLVAALALSAAGFVGVALHEGYTDRAIIPIPGDVPTVGLGSTQHEDGTPVRMGETITPPKAIRLSVAHIAKDETQLRRCFGGATLYQHEWDAYVSLAYNVGASAVCASSIPLKVRAEQYEAACRTILDFDKVRDCTKPKVWDTRRQSMVCPLVQLRGLTIRRQEEYERCLGQ